MAETQIERKVVILGSGPAGLTAAIYAGRAQLEPLVIDGPQPGGQLTITTDVENYPGFKGGIMGPILMDEFREQAERFGTEIINTWISSVDLSARPFTLYGKASEDANEITTVIKAETLIVATGASAKWLGVPGEEPVPVETTRPAVWPQGAVRTPGLTGSCAYRAPCPPCLSRRTPSS